MQLHVTDPGLMAAPPRALSPFLRRVLAGTSTYAVAEVKPMLMMPKFYVLRSTLYASRFTFHVSRFTPLALLLPLLLSLSACTNRQTPVAVTSPPRVTIIAPPSGQRVPTGREVEIQSQAVGQTPIERIDMYVDDDLIRSDTSTIQGGQFTFNVVQRWVPIQPGQAQVRVIAYDINGAPSQPAGILLEIVGEGLATATATPIDPAIQSVGTVTATASAVVVLSEGAPENVGTPPPQATTVQVFPPEPSPTLPLPPTYTPGAVIAGLGVEVNGSVTANLLNVRGGPGTEYQVVGNLPNGTAVTATGRNADASWARLRLSPEGTGWVYAAYVRWDGDVATLPVVQP